MDKRPLKVGDHVMIVRGSLRVLGRTGTIVNSTRDSLYGGETAWEAEQILSRDWVVALDSGPLAFDRADGRVVVTAHVCVLDRCLMRLDGDDASIPVEQCELIEAEQ